MDKFLPNYTGTDTTSFYDSKFHKVDSAYISGYIRNLKDNQPFSVDLLSFLNSDNEKSFADIDENSLFNVKVPLINTSEAYIDWHRSSIRDILTPGEHYFVYKDLENGETIFYGDNARFHNEIVKYDQYLGDNIYVPEPDDGWGAKFKFERSLKDTAYLYLKLAQMDSVFAINDKFKSIYNLSARTTYYMDKGNRANISFALMQKRFELDRNQNEKFSDQYMSAIKNQFFNQLSTPVSLFRDNRYFIRDYYQYYIGDEEIKAYTSEVLYNLIHKNELITNDSLRRYIELQRNLDIGNYNVQDSLEHDKLEKENLYLSLQNLVQNNYDKVDEEIKFIFLTKNLENVKNIIDNDILIDLFCFDQIFQDFEMNKIPLSLSKFEKIKGYISNTFFHELIENALLEKYKSTNFQFANNFKNTDHLKDSKDADLILKEILQPHKGKIVYMDFWGSWCGPCVAEMEYAPAAKKALEGKDVVFIYMANRTSKTTWENFIKSNNLEGENVFHYNLPTEQQSMVERKLGVPHFPTYMLFDKEGKLVISQAPRPSQLELLVLEVGKLLE